MSGPCLRSPLALWHVRWAVVVVGGGGQPVEPCTNYSLPVNLSPFYALLVLLTLLFDRPPPVADEEMAECERKMNESKGMATDGMSALVEAQVRFIKPHASLTNSLATSHVAETLGPWL